jgi:hypothetical protein
MQLLAGLERLLARVGKRVLRVEQGVGVVRSAANGFKLTVGLARSGSLQLRRGVVA